MATDVAGEGIHVNVLGNEYDRPAEAEVRCGDTTARSLVNFMKHGLELGWISRKGTMFRKDGRSQRGT